MSIVSDQTIEMIQSYWDSNKKPSFTTLVKERFSLGIYKETQKYCDHLGMEFLSAGLGRVTVTSFEIASASLFFDVLCICSMMDNGECHDATLLMNCICSLNDDFSKMPKHIQAFASIPEVWEVFLRMTAEQVSILLASDTEGDPFP